MNPAAVRLTHAVMIVAALAAIVIAAPVQAAPEVVVLPKVMVTGQRANFAPPAVVVMPKVMVTGRRVERDEQPVLARRADTKPVLVALAAAR